MPWGLRERVSWQVRFWSKVDKRPGLGPNGDCWLWTGGKRGSRVSAKSNTFYGGFRSEDGKVVLAHRVAYALAHGPIPDSVDILHKCDTPACVRDEHLFEGNQLENMRDCWKKGRGFIPKTNHRRVRGEQSGAAKLTEMDVIAIRAAHQLANGAWGTRRALALQFNVSEQNIGSIISRETWKHV